MLGEILYHLHKHFRAIFMTGAVLGAGLILSFAGYVVLGGLKVLAPAS